MHRAQNVEQPLAVECEDVRRVLQRRQEQFHKHLVGSVQHEIVIVIRLQIQKVN